MSFPLVPKLVTINDLERRSELLSPITPVLLHVASAGGKGGKVTSAGWQVTLCDPIW